MGSPHKFKPKEGPGPGQYSLNFSQILPKTRDVIMHPEDSILVSGRGNESFMQDMSFASVRSKKSSQFSNPWYFAALPSGGRFHDKNIPSLS